MDRIFQQVYQVPGTLSADITPIFTMPCDAQLLHVSTVNTVEASNATIAIGTTTTDEGGVYLAAAAIGNNSVPAVFGKANFVGAQYPHIPKGTVVLITVDFDGDSGTAAADLNLVLTFAEG